MPEYGDIEPNGHVHPRSALIAHAQNLKDPSTVPAKQLAAEFRKAHSVVEAMKLRRSTFYSEFRLHVCTLQRQN